MLPFESGWQEVVAMPMFARNRRFTSRQKAHVSDFYGWELSEWQSFFLAHKGLLSDKYLHYWRVYESTFGQAPKGNLLEIGVARGGSLEILTQLLPDWRFVGVDVNPEVLNLQIPKAELLCGSQSDAASLDKALSAIGGEGFDVVIDDGSHVPRDSLFSLSHLWPHLNTGGYYIIEDTHTSYWQEFGGGFRKRTSTVEYAKTLIDQIHREYIWRFRGKGNFLDLPGLDSVQVFDSMIVLKKLNGPPDYRRVIVPEP